MKKVRVLVAAEHADKRYLLAKLASSEPGVALMGEAENGIKAIALASRLKPNMVVLDTSLPYFVGFDDVRLSRIGGLDAALAIAERVPNTRVVLVSNLSDAPDNNSNSQSAVIFAPSKPGTGFAVQPSLRDLYLGLAAAGSLAFAEIIEVSPAREMEIVATRSVNRSWKRPLYGVLLGLLGTWLLAGVVLFVMLLISILR